MRTALCSLVVAVAVAGTAEASVERYALIIGNNQGHEGDAQLLYAESDARKVEQVLHEMGGFHRENTVILEGEDAASVRRTLIRLNGRIRGEGGPAMLFVYYSGHADREALHLGASRLDVAELEELVRGSAAGFRVLVVDACRSGVLTRVKGGAPGPSFPVLEGEVLPGEGAVFLSSSAANEDAQESDALGGSFFTHYFVSGLLGAADVDENGRVSLAEAYQFAYENTLRASIRTLAGAQHPTYRYELRGRGDVQLTQLALADRGVLRFPEGRAYLVHAGASVLGEVGAFDQVRRLSLRPGKYFIQGRGPDHLVEGEVELAANQELVVTDAKLDRIAYARLVRKGGGPEAQSHGPWAAYFMRGALWDGASPCVGASAGYSLDRPSFALEAALSYCATHFRGDAIATSARDAGIGLRLGRVIDLPIVSLDLGLSAGASVLWQEFSTRGSAPARFSLAPRVGAGLRVVAPLLGGLLAFASGSAELYAFREQTGGVERWTVRAVPALQVGVGHRW